MVYICVYLFCSQAQARADEAEQRALSAEKMVQNQANAATRSVSFIFASMEFWKVSKEPAEYMH